MTIASKFPWSETSEHEVRIRRMPSIRCRDHTALHQAVKTTESCPSRDRLMPHCCGWLPRRMSMRECCRASTQRVERGSNLDRWLRARAITCVMHPRLRRRMENPGQWTPSGDDNVIQMEPAVFSQLGVGSWHKQPCVFTRVTVCWSRHQGCNAFAFAEKHGTCTEVSFLCRETGRTSLSLVWHVVSKGVAGSDAVFSSQRVFYRSFSSGSALIVPPVHFNARGSLNLCTLSERT